MRIDIKVLINDGRVELAIIVSNITGSNSYSELYVFCYLFQTKYSKEEEMKLKVQFTQDEENRAHKGYHFLVNFNCVNFPL